MKVKMEPMVIFDGLPRQRHPGPARDAPAWQHTIWFGLQTYGAVELAEEGPVIYFNSHFVSHERHRHNPEPRPVRITEDLDSWDEVFRTAWFDLLDGEAPFELFPVRPMPPVTMYQGTMGTILIVQHPIHDHRACVIASLIGKSSRRTHALLRQPTQWKLLSLMTRSLRRQVSRRFVVLDRVIPTSWRIKVGGHLLHYGRDVRIFDGLGLQLSTPGEIGDALEFDVVDLMTRGYTVQTPESHTLFSSLHRLGRNACEARIFTFGGGVFDTHLDWYLPAQFWSTVALATSIPLGEIQLLHLVRNSPEDLATEGRFAFLLQSQADRPSSPLLRATLVDIEYTDSEQSERKVLWIQNKINRPSLLRVLRLESLCWWLTDDCRVWQNGYEIPIHQAEPLDLFDGDHLKIRVALRLDLDPCDSSHPDLDDQLHLLQKTIQEGWRHFGVSDRVHPAFCHSRNDLGFIDHQDAQQLRMTLQDRTNIEQARVAALQRRRSHIQEAPVTFHTWFLSGLSAPLCTTSRLLNLWNDPLNWHQQVRRLWQDKIDANWPFRMVLVDPRVEPDDDGGHILIVQHAHPHERAVLLSTFWHDDVTQLWSREAQFLPYVLDFDSLLRSARVLDGCARQHFLCLGFVGALPIDSQRPMYPRVGTHFELHLAEWAIIDENDLMQRSIQVSSPAHSGSETESQDLVHPLQNSLTASSSDQFCFNPEAPAFDPERPDIRTQTEFVQDLYARWDLASFSWEGEDRSSRILTFFIDHRDPHDRCDVGREIDLFDDYVHWEEIILHTWDDYVDSAEARELHVVSPQPPMLRPQYAACVLIVQAPADDMVSSLISVFEGFQSLQLRSRGAITTREHITLVDVLDRMNLFWRCAGPTSSHVCQAHFASVPLGNSGYIRGRNGYGIVVQLRPRPPPNVLFVPPDGLNLLQLSSRRGVDKHESALFKISDARVVGLEQSGDSLSLLQLATTTSSRQTSQELGFVTSSGRSDQTAREPPRACTPPNPMSRASHPPDIRDQTAFVQRLFASCQFAVRSGDFDDHGVLVSAYFVNHNDPFARCDTGRLVHLDAHFANWEEVLRQVWREQLHPTQPLAFYVVTPPPFDIEEGIVAYVILVQDPQAHLATSLVSVYDHGHLRGRSAVTTSQSISHSQLIHAMGFQQACIGPMAIYYCEFWTREVRIQDEDPFWSSSGLALYAQLQPIVSTLTVDGANCERLTNGSVAHTRWPQSDKPAIPASSETPACVQLCLEDLLSQYIPEEPVLSTVVQLIPGTWQQQPIPEFIEIESLGDSESLQRELETWGHQCLIHWIAEHNAAVCTPQSWSNNSDQFYVYASRFGSATSGRYFVPKSVEDVPDYLFHMRQLHALGHLKAVIRHLEHIDALRTIVLFEEVHGSIEVLTTSQKSPALWPTPQPQGLHQSMLDLSALRTQTPGCLLSLGVGEDDLRHLFGGEHGALHTSFEGLELPGDLADFLNSLPFLHDEVPDRYVIYVDGSSHSARHHHSTAWIEEFGTVDAWAMIVLAEIYATPTSPARLFVVGWTAQQARYAVDSPSYLGADRVGSLIAEREGLTWALLWRICCNVSTPTVVRCDSQLTCRQARGEVGAAQINESFQCLRGAYQLLEAALPSDHFRVEHIPGHSGEPFNDFTDFAAKHEALHSFYLPRLGLDMRMWRPILPHLWMIFGEQWGAPSFCGTGFNICAPALPPVHLSGPDIRTTEESSPQEVAQRIEIQLCPCFCTANVLSLYTSPHGHAGKLGYLIEQFQAHSLLFLGLQESRTPTGQISSHGVLRLCSGAHKGQGGIELWVNLAQPYGYAQGKPLKFARQHFEVLEADPHVLVVRADSPYFRSLLVVAHAPHSGHLESDRLSWWEAFTQRVLRHRQQDMLFVMIDANAGPGDCDEEAVFQSGLATSVNTPHWRSFLQSCDLALPQTLPLHEGGLDTWMSLDGSTGHCIDYVAVPSSLLLTCTFQASFRIWTLVIFFWTTLRLLLNFAGLQRLRLDPQVPNHHPGYLTIAHTL